MPPDKPEDKPADKPVDAKPAGGDTPPVETGADNPLFKALFNTAQPKADDKDKKEDAPPAAGTSLLSVLSSDKKDEKPADKKDAKPGDKKDEKPGDKPADKPADKKDEKPVPAVKLTRRMGKKAEEAAAPEPKPEPKPADKKEDKPADKKPEDDLEPEEKYQLELLRYAESKKEFGDKYKGAPAKMMEFFKKHAEFIAKKKGEDADYDFTKDNPEYQAWLNANLPVKLSAIEQRQIEREQDRDTVRQETDGKLAQERTATQKREIVPVIKKRVDGLFAEFNDLAVPAELQALIKEKGYDAAKAAMPDEYEIVEETTAALADHAEQFLLMTNGVISFNPANKTHVNVDNFIKFQCDDFAKNGGDLRTRGDRTFATRADYSLMKPEEQAKHWTFTNEDVVLMMKEIAKPTVAAKIKDRLESLEKRGWKRTPAAAPAAKADEKKDDAAPGKVRPAPGPGGGASPGEDPGDNPVLKVLGMT